MRYRGLTLLLAVVALLATAAGASAAAPTAITGPVTAVGATTATATGTVNPGGVATTWQVEYGTSTTYGSVTPSIRAGSGTANSAVSASLTGLTEGTTYHYRVVATSLPARVAAVTGSSRRSPHRALSPAPRRRSPSLSHAQRVGRPERPRDDVVVRVRHEHVVRIEDGGRNAGSGTGPKGVAAKITGLQKATPTTTAWSR